MIKKAQIISIVFLLTSVLFSKEGRDTTGIGKGTLIIGGSGAFIRSETIIEGEKQRYSTASINPVVLRFFFPDVAMGAKIFYSYYNYLDGEPRIFSIGFGPTIRSYPFKRDLPIFLTATYAYMRHYSILSSYSDDNKIKLNSVVKGITVGAGIDYFLNRNVAIESVIAYSRHNSSGVKASDIILEIGLGIFLY